MSLSASKKDKSEKTDFPLKFRMSNKNPDLLPLLKGAWLVPPPPPLLLAFNADQAVCIILQQAPFLSTLP